MKIKIITNTFEKYHRQDVAVQSWLHLQKLFPEIEIINLQFADETDKNYYPELNTKYMLKHSSQTMLTNSTKKLPLVNEIFQHSIMEDCDYFIITNSDVIIMPNLIETIIQNKPKAKACSRLDIEDIESYDSVINKEIKPVRWEPAGYDTFVFNKQWAVENKLCFAFPFFLGKPKFDVVWAGYIKIYGDNTPLGNQYPPHCFHIHHGNSSCYTECPEKDWNHSLLEKMKITEALLVYNIMVLYLKQNLLKRTPWGSFLNIPEDEKKIEKEFFEVLSIHNPDPKII